MATNSSNSVPPKYSDNPFDDNNLPASGTPFSDNKQQAKEQQRLDAFRQLVERQEISNLMALKLRKLEAYDIVIICDDSGSMNTKSTMGLQVSNPYAPATTRWDELKLTVQIVTDIAATLDEDGIDVYFLNRAPVRNVFSAEQLQQAFANPPRGYTPITRVLRQVLHEKRSQAIESGKKLLVLLATDGTPTTDSGVDDKQGLRQLLMHERGGRGEVPVVFLACTDDETEVGYLNEWDKQIPDVDVADDYISERKEILAVQGHNFPFSRGDWVCKMLLGPIDAEIDALDERRVGDHGGSTVYSSPQRYQQPSYPPPAEKKKKKWGFF
ncbi:hypothetical protein CcCBS67573_g01790 [Chytriomyces confervae]|uniref:VWFA domain-containing protein n=1 Tax=Chytriomyces confervae TaxID=246404 RepID=A0A507FPH3_9FUNG|nr:hypothetical protein HDU80_011253 [Chytriomyces hyalinus]TPX76937.1 hypothetical protein CcCBS67573_g01790 [Chytriomyces confervae]